MNSDQDSPCSELSASQEERSRIDLLGMVRSGGVGVTTYTDSCDFVPHAESFAFEHDQEKHVFRLTDAEGKTECFRDKPARYLVVEDDRETGAMRPATKYGNPTFIYVCREEREV